MFLYRGVRGVSVYGWIFKTHLCTIQMYTTELCGSEMYSKMMQMFRGIDYRRRVGYLWKAAGSGHSLDNGNTSFCNVVKLKHVSSFGNFIFYVLGHSVTLFAYTVSRARK